jgi:hypothetical protein
VLRVVSNSHVFNATKVQVLKWQLRQKNFAILYMYIALLKAWRCLVHDPPTWYSTHTCSTLLRFNCENGVFIQTILLFMRPITVHVWRSRTPAGFRCAHFTSVITTIMHGSQSTVVKTVELTSVVYHVAEPCCAHTFLVISQQ